MTDKRKHNESTESNIQHIASKNSYPRKRAAIACNLCRARKSKCDSQNPSCGPCLKLGIECAYRKLIVGDRVISNETSWETLEKISQRLCDIEARLETTQSEVPPHSHVVIPQNGNAVPPRTSAQGEALTLQNDTPEINKLTFVNATVGVGDNSVPLIETPVSHQPVEPAEQVYHQTTTEALAARPSLLHFHAPSFVHVDSWDYNRDFYNDEIVAGEGLYIQMNSVLSQPIDLSRMTTRRLQQSFVKNYLRWSPLFPELTCIDAIEQATRESFAASNPATCLAFFILAVGAITEYKGNNPEVSIRMLPYFACGNSILEKMSFLTGNLTCLQCRVLQASYFKFTIQLLQAWNSITQAARDCIYICSSGMTEHMTQTEHQAFNRTFWTTSTVLHELEATMKMFPTGIRQFHHLVPLPEFNDEDSGYHFLAQISLRNFLTQSMDELGYKSGRVIYAPKITKELRKQIQEWYEHLPSLVRFHLDATPMFDLRKSFPKGQYLALLVVLGWPSVLKIMELGVDEGTSLDTNEIANLKEQATGCIKSCCLYLSSSEEQLIGYTMGTHFSLWATFSIPIKLLIVFNCPALSFIEETKQEHNIRSAYEILRPWEHLPLVRRGLDRARILMQQFGLAEGVTPYSATPRSIPQAISPGLLDPVPADL